MKSETGNDTLICTRSTWLTLTGAGLLWFGACVWAFSAVEFDASADTSNGAGHAVQTQEQKRAQARLVRMDTQEKASLNSQVAAEQRQQAAEAEAAKLARLALEAEEEARLEAQGKAAERRRRATALETEVAALKATALAEQKAKSAAEAEALAKQEAQTKAAEEARLASEAKAADEAKLAAEAKAAEAVKLAAEAKAAEAVKLAAEAKAAEAAKLAAEVRAAEAAKLAAEVRAAEAARVAEQKRVREQADARQSTALTSQSAGVDEEARRAAADEASRIATLVRQQRSYISAKGRELGGLVGLSSRLRFAPGSATVSRQTERILDDIFNPLYLYSEASILVSVATNEYDGTMNDGLLSRDRGRAVASYLINRGLEKERFRIHIESGEELSAGTHRVRVSAEEVRK